MRSTTANQNVPDWWPFKSFTPDECRQKSDMYGKSWVYTGMCWVCLGCGYRTPYRHGVVRGSAEGILRNRHDHDCNLEHVRRVTEV